MKNDTVEELIRLMVCSVVDDIDSVQITSEDNEKGLLFEIAVGKNDVGKLIGKEGRVASALRTVARAAGAKAGTRVMLNVLNTPLV